MIPSASEIEIIVRRVLASFENPTESEVPADRGGSALTGVISVASIRDKNIVGPTLVVGRGAVVTPAAQDYCRDHKIQIVRQSTITAAHAAPASMHASGNEEPSFASRSLIVIAGTASWMPQVAKQLCRRQNKVLEPSADDGAVLTSLTGELLQARRAAIAVVAAPHATCWQAARNEGLRPAVVSNWLELGEILHEVPVNLLILSSKTWNVASTCNAARRFSEHLRSTS